jgi:anaerobic magnesium-protoporphyrin IX monomethyl ester cyclase
MATVCLINPPHPNCTDDRMAPYLGLLYIAAHLQANGIDVEYCDLASREVTLKNIPQADFYGITAYITTLPITKHIAELCWLRNHKSKIVIGGAHATQAPEDFPYADYVVMGPGEVAMVDIVKGKELDRVIHGEWPDNLFILPAYDLVDMESYSYKVGGKPAMPVLTTRGCPYKCAFCGLTTVHKYQGKVRQATAQEAYAQFKHLKDTYGITNFAVQDDMFTFGKRRFRELVELIKPLGIHYRCHGRAGYDNEDTYRLLAESGCTMVAWGIESMSQRVLDRMNKKCKVQDQVNVAHWAKKYGITSRAFLIIGFPGETFETIEETKRGVELADFDQSFVCSFIPFPGTDVAENPEKYGITYIDPDFDKYFLIDQNGSGGIVIDTKWLSRSQFDIIQNDFRTFMKNRPFRGQTQDYEKDIYKVE